jgi:hypothetical protein
MLDEHNLLDGGTALPWIRYAEGTFGHTEAYYRMRRRNFNEEPYDPLRDSYNHAAGIRQFFALGALDRNVILGYRFDTDVADTHDGKQFDYDGHQVEVGIDWAFSNSLIAGAMYTYKNENYTANSSDGREDNEHTVITRVEKRLCDRTYLVGSYVFRRNESNQKSFDYTRHITSLGVEVRY